jgi:hypothetical protein
LFIAAGNSVTGFKDTSIGVLNGDDGSLKQGINTFVSDTDTKLLGKESSLNSTLVKAGTSFTTLKTTASTELGTSAGVGKHVNDFTSVTQKALFGAGGTADKPTGGVMGAV